MLTTFPTDTDARTKATKTATSPKTSTRTISTQQKRASRPSTTRPPRPQIRPSTTTSKVRHKHYLSSSSSRFTSTRNSNIPLISMRATASSSRTMHRSHITITLMRRLWTCLGSVAWAHRLCLARLLSRGTKGFFNLFSVLKV